MKERDKNNDKVFNEKITAHEFQFDPSAWDKMEQLLDDEDPGKAIAWRYPYLMVALGIFFIGITLLSSSTTIHPVEETIDNSSTLSTNITANSVPLIETAVVPTSPLLENLVVKNEGKSTLKATINTPKVNSTKTIISPKVIIEKSIYNNTSAIISNQKITPSVIKSVPIETVKTYLKALPTTPEKRENIQAFLEANSLLQPVKYNEPIANTLPIEMGPISLKKQKVKVGMQAGASVVVAKRGIADQGKLATAIGGFINFDIDAKNTIAIEANYKNGYSKKAFLGGNALERNNNSTAFTTVGFPEQDSNLMKNGYTEVNNIERIHAIEVPVIYKRKLGTRNSIIAGVKPSLIKFKSYAEAELDGGDIEGFILNDNNLNFDFGLVAGIEHRINKNLSVDVRYNQGLLDISAYDEVRNTNSELAMTMKYIF